MVHGGIWTLKIYGCKTKLDNDCCRNTLKQAGKLETTKDQLDSKLLWKMTGNETQHPLIVKA